MYRIINYLLFFSFGLFYYFIGILIKYLNFNIFESYLFTTIFVIYGFFSSILFIIFDKINTRDTLTNIYNLTRKDKIILFGSCIPYYKLLVLSYIDLDPIIIQLLNSIRVGLNLIIYMIYYKEYYLCNLIIIINIIINISACIVPFIFYDNFSIKINHINIGVFGLIITIISVILTSINNIINEKFKNLYDFNNKYGYNTFIIFSFIIVDVIFSLMLIPLIIVIQYFNNNNNNINNIISINNFYKIITYGSIIGLFYGPYYIYVTISYLNLSSIDVSIINNIVLIFTIFISCILHLSVFYYLYIPSVILIFISSIIIIYKSELLKKSISLPITIN